MQGGTNSSEFRIPDSELEGSVELRIPGPQPSRLTPVPSDKILFPRRMLYVEAVLYATVAAAAFGLGYLTGRGGPSAPKEDANVQMRGVDGKVSLVGSRRGEKRGDEGAVVIVLPADKSPVKMPLDGLRPGDTGDAKSVALAEFGGVATRTNASGDFALSVPAAGSYRVLIISRPETSASDGQPEQRDISELEKYFDERAILFLKRCHYRWLTKDFHLDTRPIEVEFRE